MQTKIFSHEQISLLPLAIKIIDVLFYAGCGILAFYTHPHLVRVAYIAYGKAHIFISLRYQIAILWGVLLFYPTFSFFGVYKFLRGKSFVAYFHTLFAAFITVILLLAATGFVAKAGEFYSRQWFLLWHLYAFITILCSRVILLRVLYVVRKRGLNTKRVIIVGSGRLTESLIATAKNTLWGGFEVAAVFDNHTGAPKVSGGEVQPIPDDISSYIQQHKIEEVWLTLSLWTKEEVETLMLKLSSDVITLRYFPDAVGINLCDYSITEVLGFPVVNIISSPMTGTNRFIKAIEDRVLSSLILLLISSLMLLIAFLVKLSSPGPVFYRQKRIGWNGKEFEMLKFRSMPVNAEVQTGAVWATAVDKRATRIGAFLRKSSLDELPQFINVLKGDMSIVGPRPERPEFVDKFKHEIPKYMQKHLVKAGITGWAQVNGWRGNTSLEKRIEHDLYYISHWSLGFDLQIISLTILHGFVNKNAY